MSDGTVPETTSDNLTPLEKEAKEWQAKQKIAEAEKAIAQANLDRLKTLLPSGSAKPAEGKISTDEKSGYAVEMAAYNAMRHLAKNTSEVIARKGKDSIAGILLVDSLDYFAGDVQVIQISTQTGLFETITQKQIIKIGAVTGVKHEVRTPESKLGSLAISGAVSMIPQVMSAAADILGYFRMDYEVKGKTITRSDAAFRAMVANYLDYPVYLPGLHSIETSELLQAFDRMFSGRNALVLSMAQLNKMISTEAAAAKASGVADKDKKEPSPKEMLYAESEAVVKTVDEFGKSVTSISAGNTYSPLAAAVQREHFNKYASNKTITHLLYVTITTAGGEQVTGRGPFSLCGKIWYMGGCVIHYFLADMSGKIVAADSIFESSYVHYSLWAQRLSGFKTSIDYLKSEKKKSN